MRGNESTTDSGAGSESVDSESDIDWLWISSKTWWIEIRTTSAEKIWMQRWAKGRKWKQVRDGLYSGNKAQIQDSTLHLSRHSWSCKEVNSEITPS